MEAQKEMAVQERRSPFELSAETRLLMQRFLKITDGEVIPYSELSDLIQKDVQREGRHFLDSARRRLLNDEKIVIDCVINVGVKRSSDQELVKAGTGNIHRVHNAARRGAKRLLCVRDVAALNQEEQVRHFTNLSLFGAVKHFTDTRRRTRMEKTLEGGAVQAELATEEMLRVFERVK